MTYPTKAWRELQRWMLHMIFVSWQGSPSKASGGKGSLDKWSENSERSALMLKRGVSKIMKVNECGDSNITRLPQKHGESPRGASHADLETGKTTAIMVGNETMERMGRDTTNTHGERPIGASHTSLETGKYQLERSRERRTM